MEQDKKVDNIFKNGLDAPAHHPEYRDGDWDAMEKMLDKNKKRPAIIYWLPVISSVAAVLLILVGWWLLRPVVVHQIKSQQIVINQKNTHKYIIQSHKKSTGTSDGSIQRTLVSNQKKSLKGNFVSSFKAQGINPTGKLSLITSAVGGRRDTTGYNQPNADLRYAQLKVTNPAGQLIDKSPADTVGVATIDILPKISGTTAVNKNKLKLSGHMRPQFALSVWASSDLNGVNSLQQSKIGNNFGMLFSAGISKKITISTGIVYSAKPYVTGFNNYHTSYSFKTNPVNVQADCRMLDIPINIDYQVYSKNQNKISIGTGLSSYLMLHESYQYSYAANSYATGPSSYNVSNPGKYYFSVVNLQATYKRQISSKFGISVQPYMKLPISAVGVSQVRLQTTGVAVGLNWNLNSLSGH